MPLTKFFRVAVEGATADNREISRSDIEQMGKNYNRDKYGARIWLEHIRGILPDSQFKALGDVIEAKSEEVEIAGEKKLALFVKLDVTEELVEFNKKRQKIYTSIEIQPNFAKSGEAYLFGLGVTDSPSSLGTEALKLFSSRKQQTENIFTVAEETVIELEIEQTTEGLGAQLFNKVKDLLTKKTASDTENFTGVSKAVEEIAISQKSTLDQFATQQSTIDSLNTSIKKLTEESAADRKAFTEFKAQMDSQPNNQHSRKPATGGDGTVATDC
ncbi:phage capsid protein [Methylotenera oryzisoli]|uniref:Phage capsid protein n=1 Tax=Methylotenera oryzisoli TaxID=2080758 RepID=A0A4Y9VRZ0_9PROT|nr:GPO family capsid scaffolding protein [Methylotenera oryzisoli]TFW71528.1 phage capsid protein [Methylotenera oryzisoli]